MAPYIYIKLMDTTCEVACCLRSERERKGRPKKDTTGKTVDERQMKVQEHGLELNHLNWTNS